VSQEGREERGGYTKRWGADQDLPSQEKRVDAMRFQSGDVVEAIQDNDGGVLYEEIQGGTEDSFEATELRNLSCHAFT
jgi:hypothetical protein